MSSSFSARDGAIDLHAHVVPADLPFGDMSSDRLARLHVEGDRAEVTTSGRLFRVVGREAWDLEHRLAAMDAAGVSMQVLSPMPELYAYDVPFDEGRTYWADMNSWLAEAASSSERFGALGVVPLQDVERAAAMLSGFKGAGLFGLAVGTSINGLRLSDPVFEPFLAEAAKLGLCVFVHAFKPAAPHFHPSATLVNGIEFLHDVGGVAATLIASGSLSRLHDLRIGFSHGGGSLISMLPRLSHLWRRQGLGTPLEEDPIDVARRIYVDTICLDAGLLREVERQLGSSQLVLGADFPFFRELYDSVDDLFAPRPRSEWEEVLRGNALRFLVGSE